MPILDGYLAGPPRNPERGIVERDLMLMPQGSGVIRLRGPKLPLANWGMAFECVDRGGYYDAVDYFLPDIPEMWEVFFGDPAWVSASAAKAVIDAVGALTSLPAFEFLVNEPKIAQTIFAQCGVSREEEAVKRLEFLDKMRAINFLRYFKASSADAMELAHWNSPGLVRLLKNDPYHLAGRPRINFDVMDNIARYVKYHDPLRRRHAFVLSVMAGWVYGEGHTYGTLPRVKKRLLEKFPFLSGPKLEQEIDDAIRGAKRELEIRPYPSKKNPNVFLYTYDHLYYAEVHAANRIRELWSSKPAGVRVPALMRNEVALIHKLDAFQRRALDVALDHGVSVITGGPGKGKTHVIAALYEACVKAGLRVGVGASTGKAARNLDVKGVPAQTLHRLIEAVPARDGGINTKYHYENNPLPYDVVVVDEASMLDAYIFEKALYATANGVNVVLVGDPDQLPPVGPGQPFRDTLAVFRGVNKGYAELQVNHRQGAGSTIPALAAKIIDGTLDEADLNSPDVEIVLVNSSNPGMGSAIINAIKGNGGLRGSSVVALHPHKKDVNDLNREIQAVLNPGPANWPFHAGDPVMQTVNRYDALLSDGRGLTAVMNGEVGKVVSVHPDSFGNIKSLEVDFGAGRTVVYEGLEIDANLDLAYVLTVHKCQGTEADVAVLPLLSNMMGGKTRLTYAWKRQLFYTAFTRAKCKVILVTDDPKLAVRAAKAKTAGRKTNYLKMLQKVVI
ncbi:AAA family ATPase [Moorella naiadis]|uniref:AAA family ATPase n=1 Tax=Moorella naiadis (nom. illeg.) TaxID=3093670 RepID=UPI003D9CA1CD